MAGSFNRFWAWYERNLLLHLGITSLLFLWQLAHLYWLTTHVVALRLFGVSLFTPSPFLQFLIIVADYFEIPALISATILYLSLLRREFSWKYVGYLILVNSQWIHLFWITDEFVVNVFTVGTAMLPAWLAWVAIGIDYLELPVMYDTVKQFFRQLKTRRQA